jgi:hypothetical protein
MIGEHQQKRTAKNEKNRMMADRWSSPKQDGSQEQHLWSLMPDGNRVV